ncbi:MAG: transposase [Candidatus Cloacimonadaceae bacterium]|jgi:hypothetical protein
MNCEQQIITKKNLQVKLHHFLRILKFSFSLPQYKFILDMVLGIIKSQSVICNRIARALGETITNKKTCERLYRHLSKDGLGDKIQQHIIEMQAKKFNEDTVIIVDESDIVKTRAKKMEGIAKVRDGSTGVCNQNGYALMNIAACNIHGESYELLPVSSDLISGKIEVDSLVQIAQDRMIEIILACGNLGTFVFDRGFDSRVMLRFMKEHGCSFIIRCVGRRSLIVDGKEQSFKQVAKSVKLNHIVASKSGRDAFEVGLKRVKVRLNGHPVKDPDTIELWLVVARYTPKHKGAKDGFFYFLCDFPNQDLSLETIAQKALQMYRMRWKIEEMHKHIKQEYGWEKMQLMSYVGLKNMNQLLLLTMCYVYSLKSYAHKLLHSFPSLMGYTNGKWKQIYDFIYYRISAVLSYCFAHVRRYKILKFGGKWAEGQQMIIPCLKNGGM